MTTNMSRTTQQKATELFLKDVSLIRKIAFETAPCRDITDDIVNEVFVRVVENCNKWDYEQPFRPLLRKITQNVAMELWRNHTRNLSDSGQRLADWIWHRINETGEQFQDSDTESEQEILLHCLNRLSPENRLLIQQFYYEGITLAEMARGQNQKENTIRQKATRIRQFLRKCIETVLSDPKKREQQ